MKSIIYILLPFILINLGCQKDDPYGIVTGLGSVIKDGERFEIKHYEKKNIVINDTLDNLGFNLHYKEHVFGYVSIRQIPMSKEVINIYVPPYDNHTKKYNRTPGFPNALYYSLCDISCIAGSFTILEDHPDNSFTIEKLKKRNMYRIKFDLVFERDKYFTAVPVDPVEPKDTIYLTNGVFEFKIEVE